ncbi:MAG: CCA tRNA nucleotidyltransferase [Candidatus Hydrogenedentes bacterium]|nr:CCA tRNA nucleotidyltransferase [Candidatus Hydrogenedentota bacterium]
MNRLEEGARKVCQVLKEKGYIAYFAGGCVRDMLLNMPPKDYDIATNAMPEIVSKLFPKTITIWKSFGVVRVIIPEGEYEVTTFRWDGPYLDGRHPSNVTFSTPEEDAKRRDFTINALFYDPSEEKVIDFVGGVDDLKNRIVRTVGDPIERFSEDYLRLIRCARFSARLKFKIEENTFQAIKSLKHGIKKVSGERIRDEITKILTEGNPKQAFEILHQTGLLNEIIPELSLLRNIPQPPEYHPEGDVLTHTFLCLEKLPENVSIILALSILFHDVGKKDTFIEEERIRFPKHEAIGAEITKKIMERLRFSKSETESVCWLVKNHMCLLQFPQMKKSTKTRLFINPLFPLLLELVKIDILASHGDTSLLDEVYKEWETFKSESPKTEPILRGKDLIAMGYTPGPIFKVILKEVENAQLEGQINSKEEAKQFVLKNWPPIEH